jgi:hypothetical protein
MAVPWSIGARSEASDRRHLAFEPVGHVREQLCHMLMEQGLHEMRLGTNFGSNEPRHAGWPIQKRVTHCAGNLVGPGIRNADVN